MEKKKIIFLYTELATYFIACVEELLRQRDVEIHIIRWKINKEAPFNFSFSEGIRFYDRENFKSKKELNDFVDKLFPSVIYCSGWIDRSYLSVCKRYRNKIPVVVGFDNQWKGTAKQYAAVIISPFKILNHFTHCWIPGKLQEEYALRLGFKKNKILTGFYCCDFNYFHSQYLENKKQKELNFPKRFIYVGRYVEHKGIRDLWRSFIELQNEMPNDWELWCLGIGDIRPCVHPKIKHLGFIQPGEMKQYIQKTGVFVLPSHFEPWGVVIHEFVSAGFPIICSNEVGARTTFVENSINGYIYKSGDIDALKNALKLIITSSQHKLIKMSEESVIKSKLITPEKWSEQLMSLLC
jgi:glycosyltransferase involved in cell wall biosynthesis